MSLTLLDLVQQVVGEVSSDISTPVAVASNTDQTVRQLFRLANRVGQDLVREYEWRRLVTEYTFSTVNSTATYDLPADFDRMVPDTHYDRTNNWINSGPKSSQQWQWLNSAVTTLGPQFRWRLYLNQIKFYTTPTAAYTMAFEYVSRNWVIESGGTSPTKSLLGVDTDTFVFPDDVMTLGLIYRWYRAKGLDYAPALAEFEAAKAMAKAQDVPEGMHSLAQRPRDLLISLDNVPEATWSL
jgi:hypothetical protein